MVGRQLSFWDGKSSGAMSKFPGSMLVGGLVLLMECCVMVYSVQYTARMCNQYYNIYVYIYTLNYRCKDFFSCGKNVCLFATTDVPAWMFVFADKEQDESQWTSGPFASSSSCGKNCTDESLVNNCKQMLQQTLSNNVYDILVGTTCAMIVCRWCIKTDTHIILDSTNVAFVQRAELNGVWVLL